MIYSYYIDKKNEVHAYSEEQLNTVTRLTELESLIAEKEYQPLKAEYDAVLPVFFDIRENLKVMKKMTAKEIDAYLNPSIPKEQLIVEAEQQKQSFINEVSEKIAPLQDAVDLGIATEGEKAALPAWRKHRVMLNRVDVSSAPDINWPKEPE
ncbi:tail fiber assembly protein [Photorhabdus temperata]|uniref:tail fiber assembly protein n=1 Tax=Photorhabdus temperata TaxID=574560 RepID=UPI0021D4DD60|nr:tail fiber assembly protein [Photorhabdus temperata]MCT8348323.1 tail fiber assembly protein [Photorhabdus temperata]